MLERMSVVSHKFYQMSILIGNHAFIEFTGLMNEYIKICRRALAEGVDFTETNKHIGKSLDIAPYEQEYIREKLECIFGTSMVFR